MPTPEYCLLWIDWWPLCMTKAEWSGWVQAFGAVLAILAGAAAVWWQVRKSRLATLEIQRSDDVRVLQLIATANVDCLKALKLAKLQLDDAEIFWRTIDGFKAHCHTLAAVPLLQIPDVWVAMSWGRAKQELERLPDRLGTCPVKEFVDAIDISLRQFLECERVVGAALEALGARLPYVRIELGQGMALHEAPHNVALDQAVA